MPCTMTELSNKAGREGLREGDENPIAFKPESFAYNTMITKLKDIVKARIESKISSAQEENNQSGLDQTNPIELEESSNELRQEPEAERKKVTLSHWVNNDDQDCRDKEKDQPQEPEEAEEEQCEEEQVEDAEEEEQNTFEPQQQPEEPRRKQPKSRKAIYTAVRTTPRDRNGKTKPRAKPQPEPKYVPVTTRSKVTPKPQPAAPKLAKHTAQPTVRPRLRHEDQFEEGTIVVRIVLDQPRQQPRPKAPQTRRAAKSAPSRQSAQPKQIAKAAKQPEIQWLDFNVFVTPLSDSDQLETDQVQQNPKKRKPRKGGFTPGMLMSRSKEMEVEMEQRRVEQARRQQKVNLGCFTLEEIIQEVYSRGFISLDLYSSFSRNLSTASLQDFLHKFSAGKLKEFNFKAMQFTPLDHRRLAELLVNLYPQRYSLDYSCLPEDESGDFIRSSYELSPKEYFDIYERIDRISDIAWWSQILTRQKDRIEQAVLSRATPAPPAPTSTSTPTAFRSEVPKKRVKFV